MDIQDYIVGNKIEAAQTGGGVSKRVTFVPVNPAERANQFALPVTDALFASLKAGSVYTLSLTEKAAETPAEAKK